MIQRGSDDIVRVRNRLHARETNAKIERKGRLENNCLLVRARLEKNAAWSSIRIEKIYTTQRRRNRISALARCRHFLFVLRYRLPYDILAIFDSELGVSRPSPPARRKAAPCFRFPPIAARARRRGVTESVGNRDSSRHVSALRVSMCQQHDSLSGRFAMGTNKRGARGRAEAVDRESWIELPAQSTSPTGTSSS